MGALLLIILGFWLGKNFPDLPGDILAKLKTAFGAGT